MNNGTGRISLCAAMLACVLALSAPMDVAAQYAGKTTVTVGEHYDGDKVVRAVAGENWRDVWKTPVEVDILDLGTYAGGLTPERTGGRQSRTLHFKGADGRMYVFRSVDKFLHREALPEALRNTPLGGLVQDQISMLLPAAPLVVSPLYEAVDLLQVKPVLVVMPDDPRLGEYRADFAGMLGMIEENPQEGPDDTPGFAGSRKLVGVDSFLERIDEASGHRVHGTEYLAARLVQFIVGDTDRGGDQWRFAQFPDPSGTGSVWRPIARDHDYSFTNRGGAVGMLTSFVYRKLGNFGESFESLRTLTSLTYDMDRRLLADIPREQWDSVVMAVRNRLSDDVLRTAVSRLPGEWERLVGPRLIAGLQGRRDQLHTIADRFYDMVMRQADVHGTAAADRVEIERLADGSVDVRLYPARAPVMAIAAQPAPSEDKVRPRSDSPDRPYFQRRFLPGETEEIRIYLHKGDDAVHVTGTARHSIPVRVIGGAGNDRFVDESSVAEGSNHTTFYTAEGSDDVVKGRSTRVIASRFDDWLPGRPHDLRRLVRDSAAREKVRDAVRDTSRAAVRDAVVTGVKEAVRDLDEDVLARIRGAVLQDWGLIGNVTPYGEFRGATGLLVGIRASHTTHGFRHRPYKYRGSAKLLYSYEASGFGVELSGDYHPENSNFAFSLDINGTQYDAFRFFGYGNDTDEPVGDISPRVFRDEIDIRSMVNYETNGHSFGIGPILQYGNPRYDAGTPIWFIDPLGAQSFTQAGLAGVVRLGDGRTRSSSPSAYRVDLGAAAYPAIFDADEAFGSVYGIARAWVPIGRPFLALRAGAEHAFGEFPVHESVFLGGRNTLRGFKTDRFAGDGSVFGTAELHVPVATVSLLVRGTIGVFGLVDTGRVYFDGDSPGGWHTGYGGGAWFSMLGQMVSATYAYGETGRIYLRFGPSL